LSSGSSPSRACPASRSEAVGTLGQEIRDAFTLVNFNGKAFRDARIREEYLASRLDELKWAAVAQPARTQDGRRLPVTVVLR
ncbi:MAG: hypothetical protein IMZ67_03475, partial [Acidobacteria bacterium]|nr:hypothetical protein [Acidobacteriota bacterium]